MRDDRQKELLRIRLAALGWVLWLLSFVTPDSSMESVGALFVPYVLFYGMVLVPSIIHGEIADFLTGIGIVLGFALNFSILLRTPRWVSWVAPFATLAPFFAVFGLSADPSTAFGMLFFYPWALGITLLHMSRLVTVPYPHTAPRA